MAAGTGLGGPPGAVPVPGLIEGGGGRDGGAAGRGGFGLSLAVVLRCSGAVPKATSLSATTWCGSWRGRGVGEGPLSGRVTGVGAPGGRLGGLQRMVWGAPRPVLLGLVPRAPPIISAATKKTSESETESMK